MGLLVIVTLVAFTIIAPRFVSVKMGTPSNVGEGPEAICLGMGRVGPKRQRLEM